MKVLMTRLAGGLLCRSGSGMINRQSRRRRSFIDLVPSRRHMVTSWESSCPAPAPAADDPRWMILNRWGRCSSDCDSTAANAVPNVDDKAATESRTSWGRPIRVSLSRAAPPAISSICLDWAGDAGHGPSSEDDDDELWQSEADDDLVDVVAAHGDSVLFKMLAPYMLHRADYFLYRAAAAGQSPSLSLLPTCHIPMPEHDYLFNAEPAFHNNDTGLLRCGEDDDGEVLVAQLRFAHKGPFDAADLCVLRPGRREWELKKAVPIIHNDCGRCRHDLGRWQVLHAAVPAGNRFMCWVNYDHSTLLVCDMAEEVSPRKVWDHVQEPLFWQYYRSIGAPSANDAVPKVLFWQYYRSIGAAPSADDAALKVRSIGAAPSTDDAVPKVRFVSVDNRCSCNSAFMVTTWTMALNTTGQPMEWVKEGVLHCEELWALLAAAGYEDIPRVCLTWPVVSSENPDVVCFKAEYMDREANGKSWMLEVDMRRKTLISVVTCEYRHAQPIQWDVSMTQQNIFQKNYTPRC